MRSRTSDDASSDEYIDEHDYEDFKNQWPFGVTGGPTDVPAPSGAACLQINKLLTRARLHAGEFTFGGRAESLPAAPGLVVDGLGPVPVPLTEAVAKDFIAVCERSPFGRRHETLIDDNVRKSWQLESSQVKLENPLWHQGVDELSRTVAERLGYTDVPLQCVLYKLLVYAEGGHFAKHKDTEKEDGMIATLVIQPPSVHEGGDLLVYRDSETEFRHDFGKKDGSAAFLPHYAVHYADAEHALETVTKGYRLALVYSVCLPPNRSVVEQVTDDDSQLRQELAGAISTMSDGDDSFALILSHQYTEKSIAELGSEALKGIDRARLRALEKANEAAPDDKKLLFYIAKLAHELWFHDDYGEGGWEYDGKSKDLITWYALNGKKLGLALSSKMELNVLNPAQETLSRMWRPYGSSTYEGSLGNEALTRNTTYSRYAIVAVPCTISIENALKILSEDAVLSILQSRKPVEKAVLSSLISTVAAVKESKNRYTEKELRKVSSYFFEGMCELLVGTGDSQLINDFFNAFWERSVADDDKRGLIPAITAVVRNFDWSAIDQTLLACLGQDERSFEVEIALHVADGLDIGPARSALLSAAADNAVKLGDSDLSGSEWIGLLWKLVVCSESANEFEAVAKKVKQMDKSLLAPVIAQLSKHVDGVDKTNERLAALDEIISARLKWLDHQIRGLDKSFSWEMPGASFPNDAVQTFLRGPDEAMSTKGVVRFKDVQEARNYAAKWTRTKRSSYSIVMEADGTDDEAFVTITKTRDWFSSNQEALHRFKTERQSLMELYPIYEGNKLKKAAEGQ